MALPTLFFAFLLILTGVGGYLLGHPEAGATHVSYTALIPAWIGLALGILGAIALNEKARKHAMHVAAMVGLLAILGDGFQLIKTIGNTQTAADVRSLKLMSMSLTLIWCTLFMWLCVKSFIKARRNRTLGK